MALFQKKTQTLADRRASRDALANKLTAADAAVDSARLAAVRAAIDEADDKAQGDAEAKIHVAETHLAVLRNAIAEIDAEIAAAEEAERKKADRAEREATSRELNRLAGSVDKSIAPLHGVLQAIVEAFEAIAPAVGSTGMPGFLRDLMREIPAAAETVASTARARALETLAGSAPASLPTPFVPEIVPPEPEPETIQVFSLANLQWKDARGQTVSLGAQQIGALPIATAETALARGLAYKLEDPRYLNMREQAKKTGWPHLYDAQKTFDLDRDPREPRVVGRDGQVEPVFKPYDRGRPYEVKIAGPLEFSPMPKTDESA